MQELRKKSGGTDPDGIRIVRTGRLSLRAKVAWTAVAVVATGALVTSVVRQPAHVPDVRETAETQVDHHGAGEHAVPRAIHRSMSVARATPAADDGATNPAPVDAGRAKDLARNAQQEFEAAARDIANASPERAKELTNNLQARAEELLQQARDAGENRGIAAFPPPGTDPIKTGL